MTAMVAVAVARVWADTGPLDHAANRMYAPMASRSVALFQDTDGELDIDDPNDRDFIRTTVDDRVIQFANHFAQSLDVGALRASLTRLIDPAIVAAVPPAFWSAFNDLPLLPTDGTWTPQNSTDLRKIRSAFMLVSMLEFGAPGKFALYDEPGGAQGGVDTFAGENGSDPELLKKIKEYEDAWQRLVLIRILALVPSGEDPAVAGLKAARELAKGRANTLPEPVLQQWWAAVVAGPLKPAAEIWKVNRAWWDMSRGSAKVRTKFDELDASAAGKPLPLSGAQLVGTEQRAIGAGSVDPESLLERLATADDWKVKAEYQSYPDGVNVAGGTWSQNGLSLSYAPPGSPAVSPTLTGNIALMSLTMENNPIDLYVLDKSYQVAYGESYASDEAGPALPVRGVLRFLERLLEAREKYAADVEQSLADFPGGARGTPSTSGAFSRGVGIGSSM